MNEPGGRRGEFRLAPLPRGEYQLRIDAGVDVPEVPVLSLDDPT